MWKRFDKRRPKKDGWYQCTVEVPGQQRYVMDLYWYGKMGIFRDNRRQDVFNSYMVYGHGTEILTPNVRIYNDSLCNRTVNVIAWKKMPRAYMKGFVEKEKHHGNE